MTESRGRFITVDGPSGVGKSTTCAAVTDLLRTRGDAVHKTTEPSTSDLGDFTRHNANHIHGYALACLVAANRYEHIDNELRPFLDAGDTVVCDRYLASSLVLQRLDGVPEPFLLALNADILLPHVTVILTADPRIIADRISRRGVRHRFHTAPNAPVREVELYTEAAQTLMDKGVTVLLLDTTHATPKEVAGRIADAIPPSAGSVNGPTRPTTSR